MMVLYTQLLNPEQRSRRDQVMQEDQGSVSASPSNSQRPRCDSLDPSAGSSRASWQWLWRRINPEVSHSQYDSGFSLCGSNLVWQTVAGSNDDRIDGVVCISAWSVWPVSSRSGSTAEYSRDLSIRDLPNLLYLFTYFLVYYTIKIQIV